MLSPPRVVVPPSDKHIASAQEDYPVARCKVVQEAKLRGALATGYLASLMADQAVTNGANVAFQILSRFMEPSSVDQLAQDLVSVKKINESAIREEEEEVRVATISGDDYSFEGG
ncbi:hypothetical protein Tco_1035151 [Tanacetum coccineum]